MKSSAPKKDFKVVIGFSQKSILLMADFSK